MNEILERINLNQPLTDEMAMKLAMQESRKGLGFVSPNPAVGCVILDSQNKFLSKGYHSYYGGPHAEIVALNNLKSTFKNLKNNSDNLSAEDSPEIFETLKQRIHGARVFVTLEPCAHEGKTPSCAKALAKLPISEVIYGLMDPNPRVCGKGAEIILAAGIKATLFDRWTENLEETCEHFLMNFRSKRTFVSIKVASSLDGQMAMKTGESKWITGQASREHGRFLRATHDMTIVGKATVLLDDPQLNIRHPGFPEKENKILILDPQGEVLNNPGLRIFESHRSENIYICVQDEVLAKIKNAPSGAKHSASYSTMANIISAPMTATREFKLDLLLEKLWNLDVRSVLVEGGAQTISSFITQKVVNRLYLFQAPIILGASTGKSWSEQVNISSISRRILLKNSKVRRFDQDLLITGRIY